MKLVRYGDRNGAQIPFVLGSDSVVCDISPRTFAGGALDEGACVNGQAINFVGGIAI